MVEAARIHTGDAHLPQIHGAVFQRNAEGVHVVRCNRALHRGLLRLSLEDKIRAIPDLAQHRDVESPHLLPNLPRYGDGRCEVHGLQDAVVVTEVAAEVSPEICALRVVRAVADVPVQGGVLEGDALCHLAARHCAGQGAEATAVQLLEVLVDDHVALLEDALKHHWRGGSNAQPDEALEVGSQVPLLRDRPKGGHAAVSSDGVEERLRDADGQPEGADHPDTDEHLLDGDQDLPKGPGAALQEGDSVPERHVVLRLQGRGVAQLAEHHGYIGGQDAEEARIAPQCFPEAIRAHLHAVAPVAWAPVRHAQDQVGCKDAEHADGRTQVAPVDRQDGAGDGINKGLHGKRHEFHTPLQPEHVPMARASLDPGDQTLHGVVQLMPDRGLEGLNATLHRLLVAMELWEAPPYLGRLRALPDVEVVAPQDALAVKVWPQHPGGKPLVVRGAVVGHPLSDAEGLGRRLGVEDELVRLAGAWTGLVVGDGRGRRP
mmetsp:Transcript_25330/g.57613  ORF Transcript_25330/g.57613 Transcript_25330/m.57613 type:complete len:488 (+) Transcript_25330:856-2319(+)